MECGNLNSGCLCSICLRQYFWNRQNFQLPDYKEILGKLMFFIFRLRLWLVMSYVKKDQLFQIVFLEKQCYAPAWPLLRRSLSLEKLRKSSGENERRGRDSGKEGNISRRNKRKRHEERREAFSWLCCDLLPHTYPQLNPLVVAVKQTAQRLPYLQHAKPKCQQSCKN